MAHRVLDGRVGLHSTDIFAVLGVIGSVLLISTYVLFKDMRSEWRKLLTFLSLCDLVQAIYFLASDAAPNFATGSWPCLLFTIVGSGSAACSFLWTACLSFYIRRMLIAAAHHVKADCSSLVPWFHLICFGIPITSCTIFAFVNFYDPSLGEATEVLDNYGCFPPYTEVWWRAILVYFPMWTSWLVTLACYVSAHAALQPVVRNAATAASNAAAAAAANNAAAAAAAATPSTRQQQWQQQQRQRFFPPLTGTAGTAAAADDGSGPLPYYQPSSGGSNGVGVYGIGAGRGGSGGGYYREEGNRQASWRQRGWGGGWGTIVGGGGGGGCLGSPDDNSEGYGGYYVAARTVQFRPHRYYSSGSLQDSTLQGEEEGGEGATTAAAAADATDASVAAPVISGRMSPPPSPPTPPLHALPTPPRNKTGSSDRSPHSTTNSSTGGSGSSVSTSTNTSGSTSAASEAAAATAAAAAAAAAAASARAATAVAASVPPPILLPYAFRTAHGGGRSREAAAAGTVWDRRHARNSGSSAGSSSGSGSGVKGIGGSGDSSGTPAGPAAALSRALSPRHHSVSGAFSRLFRGGGSDSSGSGSGSPSHHRSHSAAATPSPTHRARDRGGSGGGAMTPSHAAAAPAVPFAAGYVPPTPTALHSPLHYNNNGYSNGYSNDASAAPSTGTLSHTFTVSGSSLSSATAAAATAPVHPASPVSPAAAAKAAAAKASVQSRVAFQKAILSMHRKLLLVPLVFVVLRIPETLFRVLEYWYNDPAFGKTNSIGIVLAYLEGVCNPGQGFCNCMIFVFMSRSVRRRLYRAWCCCLLPRSATSRVSEREPLLHNQHDAATAAVGAAATTPLTHSSDHSSSRLSSSSSGYMESSVLRTSSSSSGSGSGEMDFPSPSTSDRDFALLSYADGGMC